MIGNNLVAAGALHSVAWLHENIDNLKRLHEGFSTIGESGLMLGDMLTLAAAVKEYKPDLILELGRGWGTSTALFRYMEIPVVSICRSHQWHTKTLVELATVLPIDWEQDVNAIVGEIADQDYDALLSSTTRPMIFWDVHGYDIAEIVFKRILTRLHAHPVLVACHDMRDSRYMVYDRPSRDAPLWRAQQEPYTRFLRLGDVHSSFEQLVSIVDFLSWNDLDFHSPLHEIMSNPEALALFPISGVGWPYCLWHYFLHGTVAEASDAAPAPEAVPAMAAQ